jgi:hypothetical protein
MNLYQILGAKNYNECNMLRNLSFSFVQGKMECSTYCGTFPLPFSLRLAEEQITG